MVRLSVYREDMLGLHEPSTHLTSKLQVVSTSNLAVVRNLAQGKAAPVLMTVKGTGLMR
jgi:hypothetical protein